MKRTSSFDPRLLAHRPWTVCFYSFRGGVGRTTLALSTAMQLGERERPVGVLDLDLEAPGVDEFETFQPPDPRQPGLVEYITEYRRLHSPPRLDAYVYQAVKRDGAVTVDLDGLEEVVATPSSFYAARVMRAGRRDEQYCRNLASLDWSHLYRFEDGLSLLENMRVGLKQEFGCSCLVVDCRTGYSEPGGVGIGHLADAVVMVFQPTSAHVDGLAAVAAAVRQRERDEERVIPRLYVASKVPVLHEDDYDDDSWELANTTVQRCEGEAGTVELLDDAVERGSINGRVSKHFIRNRERVPRAHLPDSLLIGGYCGPQASAVQWQYLAVGEWIKAARIAAGLVER